MPKIERLNAPSTGKPGAIVDEFINRSGKSELYYAFYNGNRQLSYYAEFWRGATPEDISDTINDFATELLDTNPNDLSDDELLEKVRILRHQADNVPDLWADLGVE
jgi:hypothetical protein